MYTYKCDVNGKTLDGKVLGSIVLEDNTCIIHLFDKFNCDDSVTYTNAAVRMYTTSTDKKTTGMTLFNKVIAVYV